MKWIKEVLKQYLGLPREIYIIFLSRVVNNMGCFVFPMLALIMTQKIGVTKDKAGLFITLVALLSAPSILLGGILVDKIGRKKVLIIFQGFAGLVFISCGFIKPSILLAVVMMIAQLSAAASMPANDSMLADLTTPNNRKEAFSLLYMGNNLGLAIGPVMGGLLYKNHLNIVFIGDGIATLLSLILVYVFIKETIGVTHNKHGKDRSHEDREEGTIFHVLKKRPILVGFACILFIYQFSYSQFSFSLPLHLAELFGDFGARNFGLLAGINAFVVISITPIMFKLTNKLKPIVVIAFGGILYSIAFGSLGFINELPLFFVSIVVMTIGEISISINLGAYIANHTPASHRGRVNGIIPMIYGSGFAFGPLIMGKYISYFGINSGWVFIGVIMLIASLLMFLLYKIETRRE
ncbi:MAG: MFS transporter [Clostridiaceae bacterium]|nr:MFS transporter [Clostridiaceae bacterium]